MMLETESRKYVMINTHKVLYCYTRLPFGIASAPAIFQWAMESILPNGYRVGHLDDSLIIRANKEDHLCNPEMVLSRLQECGIRINAAKCVLLQNSVEYLGHVIDADGHRTSPKR